MSTNELRYQYAKLDWDLFSSVFHIVLLLFTHLNIRLPGFPDQEYPYWPNAQRQGAKTAVMSRSVNTIPVGQIAQHAESQKYGVLTLVD